MKTFAPRIIDGRKGWRRDAIATTDEDGLFRLSKLPPGEYYVSAGPKWLPSAADRAFILSLMQPVFEPGKMASWIAPPEKGIKDRPADYEYVLLV